MLLITVGTLCVSTLCNTDKNSPNIKFTLLFNKYFFYFYFLFLNFSFTIHGLYAQVLSLTTPDPVTPVKYLPRPSLHSVLPSHYSSAL